VRPVTGGRLSSRSGRTFQVLRRSFLRTATKPRRSSPRAPLDRAPAVSTMPRNLASAPAAGRTEPAASRNVAGAGLDRPAPPCQGGGRC
jgi:hypothetical protein